MLINVSDLLSYISLPLKMGQAFTSLNEIN